MNPTTSSTAAGAVFRAFQLGLRDTLTLRALGKLVALWSAGALLWLVVFLVFRAELWHAVQKLAGFGAAMGGVGTAPASGASSAASATVGAVGGAVGGALGFTLGSLLLVLAYWLCVLLTVRIAMELLLMGSIRQQALRSYPEIDASSARAGQWRVSWRNTLGPWLGAGLVVPLCLVLPLIGGPLLAAFLAYLNVRTLVNDAFDGIAGATEVRAFVATHRWHMLLLGGLLALLALVPFVGLLLPWATGSAVCHLVLRSQGDSRTPLHASAVVPSTGPQLLR